MLRRAVHIEEQQLQPQQLYQPAYMPVTAAPAVKLVNEHQLTLLQSFERFLLYTLHTDVIHPLCQAVENDLRLHVHSIRFEQMQAPNPKSQPGMVAVCSNVMP